MLTGSSFCNDSQRPSVSGRFGPPGSGFWRHEYCVEPTEDLSDVEGQFWSLFYPWMKIPGSSLSPILHGTEVEFPRDCIQVIRCRPFTFATKVVNRWFSNRTLLVGDAAHVFPPFGGQGIATGIRDAQSLAWRLAVMSRLDVGTEVKDKILRGWSQERRHAWNAAMQATKLNGSIVNERRLVGGLLFRIWMRVLWWFPGIVWRRTHAAFRDKLIYDHESCPDGFFLSGSGGGRKVAQVWVRRGVETPQLSDAAFLRDLSGLSLLVLVRDEERRIAEKDVEGLIKQANLPGALLAIENVTFYHIDGKSGETGRIKDGEAAYGDAAVADYYPCSGQELLRHGIKPIRGYDWTAVQDRLGLDANLVLIRPDFFIHSTASTVQEMAANLQKVREYFDEIV